ncbi:hypothetical protein M1N23_00065 [Dehalococcoidia bacterium]|nr:hypothetical protein [Dehalococcoidia bacterium]
MKVGERSVRVYLAMAAWIVLVGVLFFAQFLPRLDDGIDLMRRTVGLE